MIICIIKLELRRIELHFLKCDTEIASCTCTVDPELEVNLTIETRH